MFSRISVLWTATALLAASTTTVHAFTIQVQDYECQDRSISADFTDFCNNNMTCTFGEMAYVSGVLNMTDDVSSSWGVDTDTMVYLDSRLHIATYSTQLLSMQPIFLCNSYLSDYDGARRRQRRRMGNTYNFGNYNSGSSSGCPSAGMYSFENVALQLPSVPNKVYDWAATGWTGSVSIDMYLDSSKYKKIGSCQLNLVTHMDGSTSSNSTNIMSNVMQRLPEAGVGGMFIFGTLVALAFLGFAGHTMSKINMAEEETMDFRPMPKVEVA